MRRHLIFGALASLSLAVTASAESIQSVSSAVTQTSPLGTVTMKFSNWFGNQNLYGLHPKMVRANGTSFVPYKTSYAGIFRFNKFDGSGPIGSQLLNGPVDMFCMDLRDPMYRGKMVYNVVSLSDAPNGGSLSTNQQDLLGKLWTAHYDSIHVGTGRQQRRNAEAFQLSVWEIVKETSSELNVVKGPGFRVDKRSNNAGVVSLANTWLAGLSDPQLPIEWELFSLASKVGANRYQDFLFALPSTPVPEPSMIVQLIALAGVLAWVRIRGRKRGSSIN